MSEGVMILMEVSRTVEVFVRLDGKDSLVWPGAVVDGDQKASCVRLELSLAEKRVAVQLAQSKLSIP